MLYGVLNLRWMVFLEFFSRCYLGFEIKKIVYRFFCICVGIVWIFWIKRIVSKLVVGEGGDLGIRGDFF